MIDTASLADLRSRLDESYASQHAGTGSGEAAALVYRRDIRPLLAAPVARDRAGGGHRLRARRPSPAAAGGRLRRGRHRCQPGADGLAQAAGIIRIRQGDFRAILAAHPAHYAGITATDVLEHFTKPEVLATFDEVAAALRPGGVFVARVPNAVSPLGGTIRNGDFTHQTSFTAPARRGGRLRRGARAPVRRSRRDWPAPRVWWSGRR